MRITVDEARDYFSHPSQQKGSKITPDALPDEGVIYMAAGGVCGAFHDAHWPGVVMAHYGVKPEVWGRTTGPAREILAAFAAEYQPQAIIGWTDDSNRAALAFARRLGFREYGRLHLPSGTVVMQEWKQWG